MTERKRKQSISMDSGSTESSASSKELKDLKSEEVSCVSMKSDSSRFEPPSFSNERPTRSKDPKSTEPSCLSMKSDSSRFEPPSFDDGRPTRSKDPKSTEPSCLSMKSDSSRFEPPSFDDGRPTRSKDPKSTEPGSLSMKSDSSRFEPPSFDDGRQTRSMAERKRKRSISMDSGSTESSYSESSASSKDLKDPKTTEASFLSLKSDSSRFEPPSFGDDRPKRLKAKDPKEPSCLSMKSDSSRFEPPSFSDERSQCSELRKTKKLRTDAQQQGNNDEGDLWAIKRKCKEYMKRKYTQAFEGADDRKTYINSIYTKLFIVAGESSGLHEEQEFRHLHGSLRNVEQDSVRLTDIFKPAPGQQQVPIRTVMTKGVAGIGKSFAVQKFILDWAEADANKDIELVFSFAFKELNLCSNMKSLQELLVEFYPTFCTPNNVEDLVKVKVMVILDGLDESRLPLSFNDPDRDVSINTKTSVATLLANLIQGNLLPNANVWITSRPAAANQVPGQYVDKVTEIRGFDDSHKERYFKRRFPSDLGLAGRIYSHIQSSQTLDIMCQIPIFCWISAELFQEIFGEQAANPQTLTEMMAYFLFSQTKRRRIKYEEGADKTKELLMTHKEFLLKLGKLAFVQLQKNNLIFYEEDLRDCGIDITEATTYSGFCTAILREEEVFTQKTIFFFVHLTMQEFFAALYVFDCFTYKNTTDLSGFLGPKLQGYTLPDLLKITVDKVMEKENGHLDFFLRFLLGLTAESNRKVLQGLWPLSDPTQDANKKILTYLKAIHRKTLSPDSCITLFQCMVEMRDYSVKEEIQEYLKSAGPSAAQLTPMHCSALAFMLQVSKNSLDEFNLRSYKASEEGRRRLIPALRSSRKGLLADCKVTEEWVPHLVFVLKFPSSALRHLDLSSNDLKDFGVSLLCEGLASQSCRLETLRLSGCLVTENGCASLVSALKSNPAHLRELDLSYNNPGEKGVEDLSKLPSTIKINTNHCGGQRMKPGYKKYAVVPTLDCLTVHQNLRLEDSKVTWVEKRLSYPAHQDRFDHFSQVLSAEPMSGRSYCEIEAVEPFNLGVAYKSMSRKGRGDDCHLGHNNKSWSLHCSDEGCNILHDDKKIEVSSHCQRSSRMGIYLDQPAGTLSFFRVSSASVTHLYTFEEAFKEPLYAGVELFSNSSAMFMSI